MVFLGILLGNLKFISKNIYQFRIFPLIKENLFFIQVCHQRKKKRIRNIKDYTN